MARIAFKRRLDLQQPAGCGTAPLNRRGIVIVAVLVVIAILSLAAYHYTDMMTAEYRVAVGFTRAAQVRAAAESGIAYVSAMLSDPNNVTNLLNGLPFNNPAMFQGQVVSVFNNNGGPQLRFSIVIANDVNDPTGDGSLFRYGTADENGKINPNAMMKLDPTGKTLYNLLMQLPNMTDDIANSIVFWVDPKATPRSSGGDASYYAGLSPPCAPKNGPIDSLDELLLVKGVTPFLLYGYDKNRNGVIDPEEQQVGGDPTNPGWASCLTVCSRELNVDSQGNQRVYVNDKNLQNVYTNLAPVNADLATYVCLYRIYGPATLPKNTQTAKIASVDAASLNLTTATAKASLSSLYDLIDTYVSIPGATAKDPPTYYASPLQSASGSNSNLSDLLPLLLDKATTSLSQYVYGRININTANTTVLNALAGLTSATTTTATTTTTTATTGTTKTTTTTSMSTTSSASGSGQSSTPPPLLSSANITSIQNARPAMSATTAPDATYQTPTWLITQASLPVATVKALDKYITTRAQVYRFQVIGYSDIGGPVVRLDVAIDTNNGNPRIVYYRDLSDLGKGFDLQQN
jgi:type II secretory pathway component PulK